MDGTVWCGVTWYKTCIKRACAGACMHADGRSGVLNKVIRCVHCYVRLEIRNLALQTECKQLEQNR